MDELNEREITINDVVLTAVNTERLYLARKSITVLSVLDNWIIYYTENKLSAQDRLECIGQIIKHWELDNND